MRVYISGPITGVSDYRERFKAAQAKLEAAGHTVINPAELSAVLPGTWAEYMGICKVLLVYADAIFQLEGWEQSRGARLEYKVAERLALRIIKEDELGQSHDR